MTIGVTFGNWRYSYPTVWHRVNDWYKIDDWYSHLFIEYREYKYFDDALTLHL